MDESTLEERDLSPPESLPSEISIEKDRDDNDEDDDDSGGGECTTIRESDNNTHTTANDDGDNDNDDDDDDDENGNNDNNHGDGKGHNGDGGDTGLLYTTTIMPFVCQRCRQSIHITSTHPLRADHTAQQDEDDAHHHGDPHQQHSSTSLISGSSMEKCLFELFGRASEETGVDFMICMECLEAVESQMREELQMCTEEADALEQTKQRMAQKFSSRSASDHEADKRQLQMELIQEEELLEQLQKLEDRYNDLQTEHEQVDIQAEMLSARQNQYWYHWNEFVQEMDFFRTQQESIEQQMTNQSKELQRLNTTNVFNDAFHIWFEGFFGTINGFRMGKLSSTAFHQPVEWNEINAAWGLSCMLLSALERRLQQQQQQHIYSGPHDQNCNNSCTDIVNAKDGQNNGEEESSGSGSGRFHFSKYRLVPMGSFSRVETANGSTGWDLYGGGGGLFWQSKFDKAMLGFLHCLKEMGDYAAVQSGNKFELPYRIDQDKIGGLTIKFSSNSDENWTKACKYVLTNLKYLLVWCSTT